MRQCDSFIRLGEQSRSGIILFDGAMGTELLRRTGNALPCEQANLTLPNLIQEIHRAYLDAGADIIRTNSFGANRINLETFGLGSRVREVNGAAVSIARKAIESVGRDRQALIAGSIGPIRRSSGHKSISGGTIREAYREQVEALVACGVGMIFCETFQSMKDVTDLLESILQVAENARPQVTVGVTISPPEDSERAADLAADFCALISTYSGVSLLGCNCGYGPSSMIAPITVMRRMTRLPLAVLPSAGLPITEGKTIRYPCERKEFTASLMNLIERQSVQAVGGCCGTTAEYIEDLARMRAAIRAH